MNARTHVVVPLVAIVIAVVGGLFVNRYAATDAQDAAQPGDGTGAGMEVALRDLGGRDTGVATLADTPEGLTLSVSVSGLAPGEHGIHFHEVGLCEPNGESAFASAGAHVSPTGIGHGGTPAADAALADQARHAGDLGNLTADAAGVAALSITLPEVTLAAGPYTLADADGTALIVHESPDDLTTDPSGASGNRLACAVIAPPQSSAASPAASPAADTAVSEPPADLASPEASPEASPAASGGGASSVTITAIDIDLVEKN